MKYWLNIMATNFAVSPYTMDLIVSISRNVKFTKTHASCMLPGQPTLIFPDRDICGR